LRDQGGRQGAPSVSGAVYAGYRARFIVMTSRGTVFAVSFAVGFCGEGVYKALIRPRVRQECGLVMFDREARPVLLPAEANDVVIIRRDDYEHGLIDMRVCPN